MRILVDLEEDPGIRFTEVSGSSEIDGVQYKLSQDFGCGTYINAGGVSFRLSPEALIAGVHEAIKAGQG